MGSCISIYPCLVEKGNLEVGQCGVSPDRPEDVGTKTQTGLLQLQLLGEGALWDWVPPTWRGCLGP